MTYFFLLSLSALASIAHGDALSKPPDRCPDGSMPIACHGPPTCRIVTCEGDGECAPGFRCVPTSFCAVEHGCGGMSGEPTYLHAEGSCEGGAACEDPIPCTERRVCRELPVAVDAGGEDSGTGDRDSGSGTGDSGRSDSGTVSRTDAGSTSSDSDGGCCSVTGGWSLGGILAAAGMLALVARRRRR
jgi:MYXO-CTERM domain-containing protein